MAFAVISNATRVLAPAINTLRPNTQAPGLLFPLMVLSRTGGDEDVYFRRLRGATPEHMLHDLANQIVEVSNVYQTKQRQLDRALRRFRWLSMLWIMVMLLLSVAIALF